MPITNAGEIAALATAVCWALTALFFAAAGRRVGSLPVNLIRLVMGLGFLCGLCWLRRGLPLPTDADLHAWKWLALSGLLGFVFGDLCLFKAFVVLGPRLSTLVMSTSPIFTASLGWLFLHERLSAMALLGIALTLGGVMWAVMERREPGRTPVQDPVRGVLLALGGSVGQALGLITSKVGMGAYDAFAATQIRVIAGIIGFAAIFTLTRTWPRVLLALRMRVAMGQTAAGAFFGPFLGVSLSLLSIQLTTAGIAASIMATTPIIVIPFVVLVDRERIGPGGLLGTLVAVAGVVLLFNT